MRTLAYNSNCKNFIGYYENKQDVYKELARGYLKMKNSHSGGDPNYEPTTSELKAQRPRFKQLSLALLYGMGDNSLSRSLGCEVSEAQELRRFYFDQFPEVETYIDYARQYMKDHDGRVWTLFGDKTVGVADRFMTQALNMRIQGGASLLATAGFFNTATAAMKLGLFCNPYGIIHDSCQNIINVTDIIYMEQVYARYFSGYCYEVKGIKYGYDLEVCTCFRDHASLSPYDFENKVLTIDEAPSDVCKYLIDSFSKKYDIEVEGFEMKYPKYEDPMEIYLCNMESHRWDNIDSIRKYPTVNDVKIHFNYDFNDELMNRIKSMPVDVAQ